MELNKTITLSKETTALLDLSSAEVQISLSHNGDQGCFEVAYRLAGEGILAFRRFPMRDMGA